MPGDRRAGHEDRERQHPLLQGVQQVANRVAALHTRVHLAPQLLTHEAADGRARETLDHGRPDVHDTLVAPLLVEELEHLLLQGAHVRAEAVVRKALTDETQLTHPRRVVRVVQDFGPEDWNREGIHLGLVQVLICRAEELLPVFADEEDHVHRQEVDLEALAVLLVAGLDQIQWALEELDDGADDRQAPHVEGRRHLAVAPPSAHEQAGDDQDRGTGGDERREGEVAFGLELHGSSKQRGKLQSLVGSRWKIEGKKLHGRCATGPKWS
mmetsp:Transcript_94078/g.243523  ORF Transcript_94078/g.243523 Transcript_94078/m.243523 type:complete len:269 (-) Transcript_94078:7-813(-)